MQKISKFLDAREAGFRRKVLKPVFSCPLPKASSLAQVWDPPEHASVGACIRRRQLMETADGNS